MPDAEKTKDELRAAAWKLAALTSRGEASVFLTSLAGEMSEVDWRPGGRGR
jgi:hypothetical protein